MKIYNTLTRQKEEFSPSTTFDPSKVLLGKPADPKKVKMFVCGPTVYDFSHIGHVRTYVVYDVIARYLRHRGYDVFYLQNITDIEDKIIERARQKEQNPADLAQEYKEAYYEDMKKLGITSVSEYAPATQYISEIVSQVQRLIEKGTAYLIEGEGYYFDLTKFLDYGKLSGRTVEAAEDATSRIDESAKKKNKGDFALWRFSKPEEMGWDTKLGYGRPGWHIEDTAITEKFFGSQYDIHGGARDLIFPHHEAEIAQMESISGQKPFVKYWIHSGFLTINGQKMSKSLGNFVTIRDVLEKYPPEALRLMFLMAHYRSPMDYTEENLKQAEAAANRIKTFRSNIAHKEEKVTDDSLFDYARKTQQEIESAMDDDFDTPKAFASLFDLIRTVDSYLGEMSVKTIKNVSQIIDFFDKITGTVVKNVEKTETKIFKFDGKSQPQAFNIHSSTIVGIKIEDEIYKLVAEREVARQHKDWLRADQLRERIKNLGYEVDDTKYGPLVKRTLS